MSNPRLDVFLSKNAPDVFHAVIPATEIWRDDPFDVELIHAEARETFQSLFAKAASNQVPGRILLILGESGAGKTHLMRCFRNSVHGDGSGYFGYLQLTSPSVDYGKYILSHYIDSLCLPYVHNEELTGLMRLSDSLAEWSGRLEGAVVKMGSRRDSLLTAIREWEGLNAVQTAKLIGIGLEQLCRNSPLGAVKLPIMAALLYLQRGDALIKNIVLHFLRETSVPPFHQEQVPAITSLGVGFGAVDMFSELGKIMWLTEQQPMVLCVDQIEGLLRFDNPEDIAANSLGALGDIASATESSLIVISCLEGYKDEIINLLPASIRSRLISPPSPQKLDNLLQQEIQLEELLIKRLRFLYESMDVDFDASQPTFPYREIRSRNA